MLTDRARSSLALALVLPGLLLMQSSWLWLVWFNHPWQLYVAAAGLGVILFFGGLTVAPGNERRPRGGPMVEPEHTVDK